MVNIDSKRKSKDLTGELMQVTLPTGLVRDEFAATTVDRPFLKWIGSKNRFAKQIVSYIPDDYVTYIEPFLGSGAVLGALSPRNAIAGDTLKPLIDLWILLKKKPNTLIEYYTKTWIEYMQNPKEAYLKVKASYNHQANPLDLLFISRSCYGGVIRFTKDKGYISTPIGPHKPIPPEAFKERVLKWNRAIQETQFLYSDFQKTMELAKEGDVIYCDPPYLYSQAIVYGAQAFSLPRLWDCIRLCVNRNVKVILSLDCKKKSGKLDLPIPIPHGLFEREMRMDAGKSMLRRLQRKGKKMHGEDVEDRLLLTW
jgi:DNA adenine methylase